MKKKYRIAILSVLFTIVVVIAICINIKSEKINNKYTDIFEESNKDSINKAEEGNTKGVYFAAIKEDDISTAYNPLAGYSYSCLFYNGRIYTCSSNVFQKEQEYDTSGMEFLSEVYGNNSVSWADDFDMLYEVTDKGSIYKVDGYSPDSRICLYYVNESKNIKPRKIYYNLEYFDCLNDITLLKGEDLYKEILHIESVKKIYIADVDRQSENSRFKSVSFDDINYSSFIEALFEAEVLNPDIKDDITNDITLAGGSRLMLKDNYGIGVELQVYCNGYVIFESPERQCFIVKIDEGLCEDINAVFEKVYKVK